MGKKLSLVNGLPRMVDELDVPIYDSVSELISPITAGTNITLPASGKYVGDELEVYLNGQRLEKVEDYNYVGVAPRTQITMTQNLVAGDVIRFRVDRQEPDVAPIYDEVYDVVSPIITGTNITLPASGQYSSNELEVYLNGQRLESVEDYVYVGVLPRTQIAVNFDLVVGDSLRFRVDRSS